MKLTRVVSFWAFIFLLSPAFAQKSSISVPFVGCESDGQTGPEPAPKGKPKNVFVSPEEAARLTYYKAEYGKGVLAPRGWFCFSTYGSNGSNLFVSPIPIDSKLLFSTSWKGFTGPVIQLSVSIGDTSGRFEVAEMVARVFPAYRPFAQKVILEGFAPANSFHFGPYTTDQLTYRRERLVEFETPPATEGLGTMSRLLKNSGFIHGVAALSGETPDLIHLSYRLPSNLSDLGSAIVRQVEIETMR
jgi:hypothetical protein